MMATAEQTVSAVLESTNKRYVVECGESEDGSAFWRIWNDGLKEYEHRFTNQLIPASGKISITFPFEFSDTKYNFYYGVSRDLNVTISSVKDVTDSRSTTGTEVLIVYVSNSGVYIPDGTTYDFSDLFS